MRDMKAMLQAMQACTRPVEAERLVREEVESRVRTFEGITKKDARTIVLGVIGYFTGYLDRAEAGRLLALFDTKHPYFGAIEDWPKTPEETFAMGLKLGEEMKARASQERAGNQ